jgi:transcription elongation factor GreA
LLEARIRNLETKLARSRIVETHEMDADTVLLGAIVRLKDLNRNKEFTYTIVSDAETDLKRGSVSASSPVGKGLLGAKVGQTREIDVPAGKLRYEILEISR